MNTGDCRRAVTVGIRAIGSCGKPSARHAGVPATGSRIGMVRCAATITPKGMRTKKGDITVEHDRQLMWLFFALIALGGVFAALIVVIAAELLFIN